MLTQPSLSAVFATLLNLAAANNRYVEVAPLSGRSFVIAINELPQDIAITVENDKFTALADDDITHADVTISGSIKAVVNMIQDADGLDNDELYIVGKIAAAKQLQHFLASLSVDWQGFFSRFLPDEIAAKVADACEQGLHFARGGAEQLAEALKRYIIEDQQLLVRRQEMQQLRNDIAKLQLRLNAAWALLADRETTADDRTTTE